MLMRAYAVYVIYTQYMHAIVLQKGRERMGILECRKIKRGLGRFVLGEIAFALSYEASVYFMDEPSANLDVEFREVAFMFKLALQEEMIALKRNLLGNKGMIALWGVVFAIWIFAWSLSPEDFNLNFWLCYLLLVLSGGANYGMDLLFPGVFSYVPITRREKEKYILLRMSLSAVAFWLLIMAVSGVLYGVRRISSGFLPLWLLGWLVLTLTRMRENYYLIHKNLGKTYACQGMKHGRMVLFWIFRILDWAAAVIFMFLVLFPEYDGAKEGPGMMEWYVAVGLLLYEMISLLHNLCYIRTSLRRLAL